MIRRLRAVLGILPAAFWCYAVPMAFAAMGWIHPPPELFGSLIRWILPACLILLLMSLDLPSLIHLGRPALIAMAAGALGIALGGVLGFLALAPCLPPESWKGIGAMTASWIGGNANMVAVKEALNTPDSVFAPFVMIDSTVTYLWMMLLIAAARFQERWDRWVGAEAIPSPLEGEGLGEGSISPSSQPFPFKGEGVLIVTGAFLLGRLCWLVAARLPVFGSIITTPVWAYLLITAAGLGLSLTPMRNVAPRQIERTGYLLLYAVLILLGAQVGRMDWGSLPQYFLLAFIILGIQAACLLTAARWFRLPFFLVATASQANVGGLASAPVVAAVYQPHLAGMGLLLAITGHVIGTQAGLIIAWVCKALQ